MADAQILYAESVAATTCSGTSWVDLATIAAGSFTVGETYLIIANQVMHCNSSTIQRRARLVHGTTPTEFTDAALSWEGYNDTNGPQAHEVSWMFLYTQPNPAEAVKIQFSLDATGTGTNRLSQVLAVKLSGDFTSGVDYFWNEDLGDYTMTGTPTAKAITASFTPNGTDRWLFIGHMIHDVVGITTPIGFELYDSVAGVLNSTQQEGEDATLDFLGHNLFWAGVPTNAARTLAVRPFNSGSSIMLASRVIAINLAKFAQSASAFDATEVDPATGPSYSTVATVAPTPTVTGDWVYIAASNHDVNETLSDFDSRLQVNPDGGGLVDDPAYTNGILPLIDNWDATDETPHNVFNLRQLNSGGARTINFDIRQTDGTLGRAEDNLLVAFSVALASTGFSPNVTDSASIGETITRQMFSFADKTDSSVIAEVITRLLLSFVDKTDSSSTEDSVTVDLRIDAASVDASVIGEVPSVTLPDPLIASVIDSSMPADEASIASLALLITSAADSSAALDTSNVTLPNPLLVDIAEPSVILDTVSTNLSALLIADAADSSATTDTPTVVIESAAAILYVDVSDSTATGETTEIYLLSFVSCVDTATSADVPSLAMALDLIVSISDVAEIGEVIASLLLSFVSVIDGSATGEQIGASMELTGISVTDALVIADTLTVIPLPISAISLDSASASDTLTITSLPVLISASEEVTTSEIVLIAALTLTASVSDSSSALDVLTITPLPMLVDVFDDSAISEVVFAVSSTLIVSVDDPAVTDEQVSVIVEIIGVRQISVADGISLSESVAVSVSVIPTWLISVSESAGAADSVAVSIGDENISVSDTIALAESIQTAVLVGATASDQAVIGESVSVALVLSIGASDVAVISDSVSLGALALVVAVAQGATISEFVQARIATNAALEALFKGMYKGMYRRMRS